jgi:hypothetical protein
MKTQSLYGTKIGVTLLLLLPFITQAQPSKLDSIWRTFQPFIGIWTGTGEGVDGSATYERSYQFVLNKKYIEVKNKSVYLATQEKPKYVHEDYGYISYDKMRKTFVFRQFHSEGFINQYTLDSLSADGKTIVFVSESIENIPRGWRARETYTLDNNKIIEVFNLAEPNKNFEPYTKAILSRKIQ